MTKSFSKRQHEWEFFFFLLKVDSEKSARSMNEKARGVGKRQTDLNDDQEIGAMVK